MFYLKRIHYKSNIKMDSADMRKHVNCNPVHNHQCSFQKLKEKNISKGEIKKRTAFLFS